MTALLLAAALVGSYLLGALSPASMFARRRGVDLTRVGSGNPGASNAGRALGRRTGLAVAVLDIAKGAVPAAVFGAVDHWAGLVAGEDRRWAALLAVVVIVRHRRNLADRAGASAPG